MGRGMAGVKKRYYAVIRGSTPGIYTTWHGLNGAQEQVKGFPGALYRGFTTLTEARDFLSQGSGDSPHPSDSPPNGGLFVSKPPGIGKIVSIYTDGGCINNPGPGGYGVVIIDGRKRTELSGGYRLTTNNRMELMAAIVALRSLKKRSLVTLTTDSQYVVNGIQKGWAMRWRSRNWMRDKNHRAENSDLWAELLDVLEKHEVSFQWVRGHSGHPENERCDALAKRAAHLPNHLPDTVYERSRQGSQEPRLFD
jgi:ribonuclease HI